MWFLPNIQTSTNNYCFGNLDNNEVVEVNEEELDKIVKKNNKRMEVNYSTVVVFSNRVNLINVRWENRLQWPKIPILNTNGSLTDVTKVEIIW